MTRIASAALKLANGRIVSKPPPARHPSLILLAQATGHSLIGHVQGFMTTENEFVTRTEGYDIAVAAGQIITPGGTTTPGTLYTEDLF